MVRFNEPKVTVNDAKITRSNKTGDGSHNDKMIITNETAAQLLKHSLINLPLVGTLVLIVNK